MSKTSAVRALLVATLWLSLIGTLAVSYRYLVSPSWKEQLQGAREISLAQWMTLAPADIRARSVTFSRGSAQLSDENRRELQNVYSALAQSPQTYVRVIGQARQADDASEAEANKNIACARAQTVADFLADLGVSRLRIAVETELSADGASAVRFVMGEAR